LILKHLTYKLPASSFSLRSSPIASALCSLVIEWNNKCKVSSRGEPNAGNASAACFNIDRKQRTSAAICVEEGLDVFKRRLGPDFNWRAFDMCGVLFIVDFAEIRNYCGSQLPLSVHSARMISAKQLIPTNAMSANSSCTPKFPNPSSPQHSPYSSIPQADNEIRIISEDFIPKTIQFWGEFRSNIPGFEKLGIVGEGKGFASAEVFEFVSGWVDVEDVGADEGFTVVFPDFVQGPGIAGGPEAA